MSTSQTLVASSERWFPDSYVFVLVAACLVGLGVLAHGSEPLAISKAFGDGFWSLIPITMQMALVAIGGYVVAVSPPVAALMRRAAALPRNTCVGRCERIHLTATPGDRTGCRGCRQAAGHPVLPSRVGSAPGRARHCGGRSARQRRAP
ncbi:hypothetical protein AEGHOMDF_5851 [Methylobacterium soli]|nr:hypothetical protein AEGHOMDF_5851 [Methylobacterium soli]